MRQTILLLICLGLLAGCRSPNPPDASLASAPQAPPAAPIASIQDPELRATFDLTVTLLRAIGQNAMAGLSYQGLAEQGGSPVDYIAASAPTT